MIKYTFSDEIVTIKNAKDADPQVIGEALATLSTKAGGPLTPQAVVAFAADPKSPLHRHFEWDDKIAADKFRQDQAREMIRLIRIDDRTDDPPRAFLSVADRGGVAYRTLGDVQSSLDLQRAVLAAAERDLDAFEKRYRELSDICNLVREAKTQVRRRRHNLESRAQT